MTTLIKAYTEFNACAAVSTVTINWKGSTTALGYEDISAMESQFDPLPKAVNVDEDDKPAGSGSKTDAEVMMDMIDVNSKKLDDLDRKITHIVNLIDSTEQASSSSADPMTGPSSKSSKRKSR